MFIKLLSKITGKERYKPRLEWSKRSFVFNLFRIKEQIFGREVGVRMESKTESYIKDGKQYTHREFYTFESAVVWIEYLIWVRQWDELNKFVYGTIGFLYEPKPGWVLKRGAIAYDAVSSNDVSSGDTVSVSHTSTGSDRAITGWSAHIATGGFENLTDIQYPSGTNLTVDVNVTVGAFCRSAVAYKGNQASGANTLVTHIANPANAYLGVAGISFSGADTAAVKDTSGSNTGTSGTTSTVNLTTTKNNSFLASSLMVDSTVNASEDASQTERYNQVDPGANYRMQGSTKPTTTAGAYSMIYTGIQNSDRFVQVAFAVSEFVSVTPITIQKSLKYAVRTNPSAITKSLKYTVKRSVTAITKSLKYTVKTSVSAITKSLKYTVRRTPSTIQKSLKYTVKTSVTAITKSLKYTVRIAQTAITKTLIYDLRDAIYTRENTDTLPDVDDLNLATQYSHQDYIDVETDDDDFVYQNFVLGEFGIHQFKKRNPLGPEPFTVTVKVICTVAPVDAPVHLEVFNRDTELWEEIDMDDTTASNTEFALSGSVSSNLTDYFDAEDTVSCRVWQLN